jgi:hypothetical protein
MDMLARGHMFADVCEDLPSQTASGARLLDLDMIMWSYFIRDKYTRADVYNYPSLFAFQGILGL